MAFFQKFLAFLKAMVVHIHFSLRVKISRDECCDEEKAEEDTQIGGTHNE